MSHSEITSTSTPEPATPDVAAAVAIVREAAQNFQLRALTAEDWKAFAGAISFADLAKDIESGAWALTTQSTGLKPAVAQQFVYRGLLGGLLFLQGAEKPPHERPSFAVIAEEVGGALGDDKLNSGRLQAILQSLGIKNMAAPASRATRKAPAARVAKIKPNRVAVLNEALASAESVAKVLASGQTPAEYTICRIRALAFAGRGPQEIEQAITEDLGDISPLRPGCLQPKRPKGFKAGPDDDLFKMAYELGHEAFKARAPK